MTLGERIKLILDERNIKQAEFAKALGVTSNYVNLLVNNKKHNISDTLAKLIEEMYGYSSKWVMTGEGEEKLTSELSDIKIEFIKKVKKMPDDEVIALLAFANSLESVKGIFNSFNETVVDEEPEEDTETLEEKYIEKLSKTASNTKMSIVLNSLGKIKRTNDL